MARIAAYRQFEFIGREFRDDRRFAFDAIRHWVLHEDKGANQEFWYGIHLRSTPQFNTARMRQNGHRAKHRMPPVEATVGLKR